MHAHTHTLLHLRTCLSNSTDHMLWLEKISPVGDIEPGMIFGGSTAEVYLSSHLYTCDLWSTSSK